jgi:hypothetical protein
MNKNVVGIILIIGAIVLLAVYAWPKLKPYMSSPAPAVPGAPGGDMGTTMPI